MADRPSLWEQQIKAQIRRRYAKQAAAGGLHADAAAKMRDAGYPEDWIRQLPENLVNEFSGCGCPLAGLEMGEGEIIADLGCGAGIDSALASILLPNATVLSIDLTPEMLTGSQEDGEEPNRHSVAGDIEWLPLADASVDFVIANASFTLATDKKSAFSEGFRILKSGGRLSIAYLVSEGNLPREIAENPVAHTSSLGGVIPEDQLTDHLEDAGFTNVHVTEHRPFPPVTAVAIKALKS